MDWVGEAFGKLFVLAVFWLGAIGLVIHILKFVIPVLLVLAGMVAVGFVVFYFVLVVKFWLFDDEDWM